MTDDIVAELDRWLAVWRTHFAGTPSVDMAVIQRARDEIVTLRAMREAHIRMLSANNDDARDEALEEAARLCDRIGLDGFASDGAAAIRALKGEH